MNLEGGLQPVVTACTAVVVDGVVGGSTRVMGWGYHGADHGGYPCTPSGFHFPGF